MCELHYRARDARRRPAAKNYGEQQACSGGEQCSRTDLAAELDITLPRIPHEQNPQHLAVLAGKREGVNQFVLPRVPRNRSTLFVLARLNIANERGEPLRISQWTTGCNQMSRIKCVDVFYVFIKHHAHARRQLQ